MASPLKSEGFKPHRIREALSHTSETLSELLTDIKSKIMMLKISSR